MNISHDDEAKDLQTLLHTVHLTPLSEAVFKANEAKGFWDEDRNIGELLMLVTSELSEALEAMRKERFTVSDAKVNNLLRDSLTDLGFKEGFEADVKDTFPDEIADAIIRLLDLCGGLEIDISKHVHLKLRYNKMRAHKHGKSF
jgi:NTP pyrophosphatase (non-canonical NTP hydrolase)